MPSTLLLSALALVTCGHLAAAQVTPVATFEQLKQAITSGAAHIELQAHLDLRNVAQGQTAVFQDPAFQSFRGSCENAPLSFGAFTFAGKEPRMCVILLGATRQLFAWPQGLPGASAVWLDSLWLQSTADSQGAAQAKPAYQPMMSVGKAAANHAAHTPPPPMATLPPPAPPAEDNDGFDEYEHDEEHGPSPPAQAPPTSFTATRRLQHAPARRALLDDAAAQAPLFVTDVVMRSNGAADSAGMYVSGRAIRALFHRCQFQSVTQYGVHIVSPEADKAKLTVSDCSVSGQHSTNVEPPPGGASAVTTTDGEVYLRGDNTFKQGTATADVLLQTARGGTTWLNVLLSGDAQVSTATGANVRSTKQTVDEVGTGTFVTLQDPALRSLQEATGYSPVWADDGAGGGGDDSTVVIALVAALVGVVLIAVLVGVYCAYRMGKCGRRRKQGAQAQGQYEYGSQHDAYADPHGAPPSGKMGRHSQHSDVRSMRSGSGSEGGHAGRSLALASGTHSHPGAGSVTGSTNPMSYQNNTLGTLAGSTYDRPNTLGEESPSEQLVVALDNLAVSQPRELFAGRYSLLNEREVGGQAIVNFARDSEGGFYQFAIKFFHSLADFSSEVTLYEHPVLRQTLPQLFVANDNADSAVRSRSGFAFPPYLVLERGITLDKWTGEGPRKFGEILSFCDHLAELLATLHAAGKVHRDLKPGNILYMLNSTTWRLLDFGIVADIGEVSFPRCTPVYAPPEVLRALEAKEHIPVHASQDIWALGVMVYEAITNTGPRDRFARPSDAFACASGARPWPWDLPAEQLHPAWRRSRLRAIAQPCLNPDAAQRPSAQGISDGVLKLSSATTYGA